MRSPEIGTFNSAPELGVEEFAQRTLSWEEILELINKYVGESKGLAKVSRLAQLENSLESRGADHETLTRFYELVEAMKEGAK